MKKGFIKIFLLLIIAMSVLVVGIVLGSQGNDTNYFNQNVRHTLTRYGFLRNLFRLHYDGDARSEYLGSGKTNIVLRVGIISGVDILDTVWKDVTSRIESATGKRTSYLIIDTEMPESLTEEQYFKELEPVAKESSTAYIYALVLGRDRAREEVIGSTYREQGIIAYYIPIQNITKTTSVTYNEYITSTLLHEFGHQLGLPHNTEPDCLMNEHAGEYSTPQAYSLLTAVDFCSIEIEQIKNLQY